MARGKSESLAIRREGPQGLGGHVLEARGESESLVVRREGLPGQDGHSLVARGGREREPHNQEGRGLRMSALHTYTQCSHKPCNAYKTHHITQAEHNTHTHTHTAYTKTPVQTLAVMLHEAFGGRESRVAQMNLAVMTPPLTLLPT